MTDDQAAGMWWGLFIGDAMGCPLEFTRIFLLLKSFEDI